MNQPTRLENYERLFSTAASATFINWSNSPTPIPLFRASSDLILHCTLTAFFGPTFVAHQGDALCPLIREFERAFVDPWVRVLPLWATPAGRRLRQVYGTLKEVFEKQVRERLNRGKDEGGDYLGFLLSMDRAEEFMPCYGEHLVRSPQLQLSAITHRLRR